jgi:rsbT co-antagonist protein RsbR
MSEEPMADLHAAELSELRRKVAMFQQVLDSLPGFLFWKDREGRYLGCTQRFAESAGYANPTEMVGKTDYETPWAATEADSYRADDLAVIKSGQGKVGYVESQQQADGSLIWVETSKVPLRDHDGSIYAVLGTYENITERKLRESEELRRREEIIAAQANTLEEISTPLIPLGSDVLLMPLVGTIDSRRAQQMIETLLEGIGRYQAETAILDITGVRVVDTQVADALLRVARAARLLGTTVYLSGISAEVAQTLVQLGASLDQIITYSNLQRAIEQALRG